MSNSQEPRFFVGSTIPFAYFPIIVTYMGMSLIKDDLIEGSPGFLPMFGFFCMMALFIGSVFSIIGLLDTYILCAELAFLVPIYITGTMARLRYQKQIENDVSIVLTHVLSVITFFVTVVVIAYTTGFSELANKGMFASVIDYLFPLLYLVVAGIVFYGCILVPLFHSLQFLVIGTLYHMSQERGLVFFLRVVGILLMGTWWAACFAGWVESPIRSSSYEPYLSSIHFGLTMGLLLGMCLINHFLFWPGYLDDQSDRFEIAMITVVLVLFVLVANHNYDWFASSRYEYRGDDYPFRLFEYGLMRVVANRYDYIPYLQMLLLLPIPIYCFIVNLSKQKQRDVSGWFKGAACSVVCVTLFIVFHSKAYSRLLS
ncbi:hypothetical protein [Vibrio chagasii]|uniref:hypothetical protein n=1 Tax=Vibrio chagasii TaxID=170679 RepID=UPI003DA0897D